MGTATAAGHAHGRDSNSAVGWWSKTFPAVQNTEGLTEIIGNLTPPLCSMCCCRAGEELDVSPRKVLELNLYVFQVEAGSLRTHSYFYDHF